MDQLPGYQILEDTLKTQFQFEIERCKEINAGNNNKLYALSDKNSDQKLLLKYYFKDDRNRLEREYAAYSYLHDKTNSVPKAYFKNDEFYFAVYSFEQGKTKDVSELNKSDVTLMAQFLVDLTLLSKETEYKKFPQAVLSCLSIQDYVDNCVNRLNAFLTAVEDENVPAELVAFNHEYKIKSTIEGMISNALEGLSEEDLNSDLAIDEQTLCPIDYGPHNTLIDEDTVMFVDFEYFGWDDMCRVLADVLVHDRSFDLDQSLKDLFISTYIEGVKPDQKFLDRLELVKELISIEWLTIYLSSITPKKIESRAFADSNFDKHNYIVQQINKYKKRIAIIAE